MKVAYLINQYPKVSHTFIRREILALERQGFEIERIALRGHDAPLPDVDDQSERERTRYVLRRGVLGLLPATFAMLILRPIRFAAALARAMALARESERSWPYHLAYMAEACCIVRWLRASKIRHVHAHFGTNSAEIALLSRTLGGPPFSFTVHGPEEFLRPMGLAEKVGAAAFVVAVSDFGRSQLYYRTQYPDWPKIHVVHCGVDAKFVDNPSGEDQEHRLEVTPLPRLICVGRLCEAKGQLLLVEAASRLAAQGIAFDLVLAGDGPLRAPLERLIDLHGLASRVRITGWLSSDRVRAEIQAARALVLPSFAEGLPVVLMEAMALRRPVLTTYVGGIPELVRDGENGWLVAAGSLETLVTAMERCLTTPVEELRRLGASGHDRVLVRHSVDTEVAKLAELFRSCG